MRNFTEYMLFALLFAVASVTFLWILLAIFSTLFGGQR